MNDDLFSQIRHFTAEELRVDPAIVGLQTRLQHDLGVDGADGWEFIEAFGTRFSVDLTGFRSTRYFGPEAGPNPFLWLWWSVTRSWPALEPITLADLVEAARSGRWITSGDT